MSNATIKEPRLLVADKGHIFMLAETINVAAVNAPLSAFAWAINGSFVDSGRPCSIAINWGKVLRAESCHSHIGCKETVLFQLDDGTVDAMRVISADKLPAGVRFAVGGMGLLGMRNDKEEGFVGDYADVKRRTDHNVIGYKDGRFWLGIVYRANANEVERVCYDYGLEYAVLLDGGGWAGINTPVLCCNLHKRRNYIIQAV